jgi:effector-binding domain-containing protein
MKKWISLLVMVLLVVNAAVAQDAVKEESADSKAAVEKTECCDKAEGESKTCCEKTCGVQIKTIEPFDYAAVEMTGSYEQSGAAFGQLYQEAGIQGLPMDGQMMGIYYNDPFTVAMADLKWEVGLPVPDASQVKEPLKGKTWKATQLATLVYEGPFDENYKGQYAKIIECITKKGLVPAGPGMEKYMSMPAQDENGVWSGKVEICMPVMKKAE